jgi:hypothetical protein
MYLGTRKVRSAGRTSGSIEVTLPVLLVSLEGVECRLVLRDGSRPEIVLQPDLSSAQSLFRTLWQQLRLGLGDIDDIGDFSPADFTVTLFPPGHWQERPPLAYADALTILQRPNGQKGDALEALTRLLAFLAVAAGQYLNLKAALALAFGDAIAYLITGYSAGLGTDFERGMAHRTFREADGESVSLENPFDDQAWRLARPRFRAVYQQFRIWQDNPQAYAADRDKWYRAFALEMGTQMFSMAKAQKGMEVYLERSDSPAAGLWSSGPVKQPTGNATP